MLVNYKTSVGCNTNFSAIAFVVPAARPIHITAKTQSERIVALLRERRGEWVPAPELARISLQYSARLHHIRHEMHLPVVNRVDWVNGAKHGFFKLLSEIEQRALACIAPVRAETASLFRDGELREQHRDDG